MRLNILWKILEEILNPCHKKTNYFSSGIKTLICLNSLQKKIVSGLNSKKEILKIFSEEFFMLILNKFFL